MQINETTTSSVHQVHREIQTVSATILAALAFAFPAAAEYPLKSFDWPESLPAEVTMPLYLWKPLHWLDDGKRYHFSAMPDHCDNNFLANGGCHPFDVHPFDVEEPTEVLKFWTEQEQWQRELDLHTAINALLIGEVERLLNDGVDPNAENHTRHNLKLLPLHKASKFRSEPLVRLLLDFNAKPNPQDDYGLTPLHYAAKGENFGPTASMDGQIYVIQYLLEAGADPNVTNRDGFTPLHLALADGAEIEGTMFQLDGVVRLLLDAGANPNLPSSEGYTPLHFAADFKKASITWLLLNAGADPNVTSSDGYTPLHYATADLSLTPLGYMGMAYHTTSVYQQLSVIRLLLEYGADPNIQNGYGRTPLHHAASSGIIEIVKELLDYGADPNVPNNNRWTPLHEANSDAVKQLLLNYEANPKRSH